MQRLSPQRGTNRQTDRQTDANFIYIDIYIYIYSPLEINITTGISLDYLYYTFIIKTTLFTTLSRPKLHFFEIVTTLSWAGGLASLLMVFKF